MSREPSVPDFLQVIRENPVNVALCERLATLCLPDGYLVAGCLFQTLWNRLSDEPAAQGVADYDVFYCDASDLSWQAEDAVIQRVRALVADLGVRLDVKNQARVHLWYESRFGQTCPVLTCARDGIDRFPVACTCVGLELSTGALYAPFGLADLYAGRLKPNPNNPFPRVFEAKARSYRARWPWLQITASR